MFPDSVLEDIRSRLDIVHHVSRYVDLKRAGSNFRGLCPFHQEKTPSFHVSPSKAIYKCFGCGAGGNVFTFMRDMEGVSFSEAVRMLAREAGVTLPESGGRDTERDRSVNEALFKINDEARAFFMARLSDAGAEPAQAYLKKRGLSAETAATFSVGYAPDGWDGLLTHLKSKGLSEEETLRSGLVVRNENGRVYDKFRNRLMFPIQNLSGLTCGFTGRVLDDKDQPKYLNSPETPVFSKGRLLYGLPPSREPIRTSAAAVMVEGNVDLLTLFQGGIRNIVATSGTALTEVQALLIKRFCDRITLVYDGDNAGLSAAQRGIAVLMNAGLLVRIVALPPGEDPDSFFKKYGLAAFTALIEGAHDIVDFSVDNFIRKNDLSQAENKARLAAEIAPLLQAVDNAVLRAELLKKAAARIGTREELIVPKKGRPSPSAQRPAAAPVSAPEKSSPLEMRIIELLMRNPAKNLAAAAQFIREDDFEDSRCRTLFLLLRENGGFSDSMLSTMNEENRKALTDIALKSENGAPEDVNELSDLLMMMRENRLKRERAEIKRRMSLPEADLDALLKRFNELSVELKNLRA